jgi:hypothetical protein
MMKRIMVEDLSCVLVIRSITWKASTKSDHQFDFGSHRTLKAVPAFCEIEAIPRWIITSNFRPDLKNTSVFSLKS